MPKRRPTRRDSLKRNSIKRYSAGGSRSGETRTTEAVTVAWSLTVVTCVICDLVAAFTRLLVGIEGDATTRGGLEMFSGLIGAAAALIGLVSIVLLVVVIKIRRVPPPRGFVLVALVAALAPWLFLALKTLT